MRGAFAQESPADEQSPQDGECSSDAVERADKANRARECHSFVSLMPGALRARGFDAGSAEGARELLPAGWADAYGHGVSLGEQR